MQRRQFLSATAGSFAFLGQLPELSAGEVRRRVQVSEDIEPLVRLIEDTPRNQLLEAVAGRIRQGASYQPLLSALMLAGVRGIRPRPVGFKFHAVLVVNSAHLASLSAPDRDRWLPLFWALDNYKISQERNRQEGDWSMAPLDDSRLPEAAVSAQRFREAMDNWDEEGADRAIARWSRVASLDEVYEAFWRLGARDFRDIGHKAIFVANSYRTLQTIGWRHAEPIVRSLAYALVEHEGTNPKDRDDERDRPGRDNLRKLTRIRADWQSGRRSREATLDLAATLRSSGPGDASDKVVSLLNDRIDPASVWDGLFLGAGELLMRQPGIVGLHCVTTINAMHFGWQTTANDETRRFLMLQGAAFLPMFRQAMQGRGQIADTRLDTLEAAPMREPVPEAIDAILADATRDRGLAARKLLGLLSRDPQAAVPFINQARRMIFLKGNDSHDYKFSSAAMEDYFHTTSDWRNLYLASALFQLKGSGGADNGLVRRTQAALAG